MPCAIALLTACHAADSSARPQSPARTIAAALDSCNALAWPRANADTSRVRQPAPKATGAIRSIGMFSLFIPDYTTAKVTDTVRGGVTLTWSDCPGCDFGVGVQPDSGISVEKRIALKVASQARIDSINHDPHTEAAEFDEMDGPPRPFVAAGARGYLIDNDCGDCASTSILFGRPGYIAAIGFGGSDDIPEPGRHFCQMTVIAKTFAWR